jgi:kumamolisin
VSANISKQTIGILEFGGGFVTDKKTGEPTDINRFFEQLDLAAPAIVPVSVAEATNCVLGHRGKLNSSDAEVTLDIDVAGSVANGARLILYFAPNTEKGLIDGVTTAIYDSTNAPSVLSISWGSAELDGWAPTASLMNNLSMMFREAAAVGITVVACTLDSGSDCGVGDGKAHVAYPASDPWVLACGGTTITTPANHKFEEVVWNDDGVTGGGISVIFPLPAWQQKLGVPPSINDGKTKGRGIPDVAGYANGYSIELYGKPAGSLWGTSEAAPLYAGLIAQLNAELGYCIGYINPTLYECYGTGVFHPVAGGGSNSFSFAEADGSRQSSPGYTSNSGWNACTGLGSVNGKALLKHLRALAAHRS